MLITIYDDPHKGRGYIATTEIPVGTVILIEKPFYSIDLDDDTQYPYLEGLLDLHRDPKFLQMAPLKLTTFDKFTSLVDDDFLKKAVNKDHRFKSISHLNHDQLWLYYEKYSRNAFSFNQGQSAVLLSQGTFFNHSCLPNVIYFQVGNKMFFVTTQRILKNQELTISYINPVKQVKIRQSSIVKYGFVCNCLFCLDKQKSTKLQSIKEAFYCLKYKCISSYL
jgi:hypothetical protein